MCLINNSTQQQVHKIKILFRFNLPFNDMYIAPRAYIVDMMSILLALWFHIIHVLQPEQIL